VASAGRDLVGGRVPVAAFEMGSGAAFGGGARTTVGDEALTGAAFLGILIRFYLLGKFQLTNSGSIGLTSPSTDGRLILWNRRSLGYQVSK